MDCVFHSRQLIYFRNTSLTTYHIIGEDDRGGGSAQLQALEVVCRLAIVGAGGLLFFLPASCGAHTSDADGDGDRWSWPDHGSPPPAPPPPGDGNSCPAWAWACPKGQEVPLTRTPQRHAPNCRVRYPSSSRVVVVDIVVFFVLSMTLRAQL